MNKIGHNQPDMTGTAVQVAQELSAWMAENPVIENEDQAKQAKVYIDRGALCVNDLEDERSDKVRPLIEQTRKINDHYRGPRELLQTVVATLRSRIETFLYAEELKRQAAAEAARRVAEEAERAAREAERVEQERLGAADAGVLGVDVASAVVDADRAFADYEKASREAALAESEAKVKVTGGFRRALSLRNKEVIYVWEPTKIVADLEMNHMVSETLIDALLKAARFFKRKHGRYPAGIRISTERRT